MANSNNVKRTPAEAIINILIWGAVSVALFFPIVVLQTYSDTFQNLTLLKYQWVAGAVLVALVMALRAVSLFKPPARSNSFSIGKAIGNVLGDPKVQTPLLWAGLGVALVFPLALYNILGARGSLTWIDTYGIVILIYILLGWGLNIVVGFAGLLDLGYVAFYAVGAYSYAILVRELGLSFWVLLPLAGILAAFWGVLLGFPVLRLRGDYLAIVTLAFGEIIHKVLINWKSFSGGNDGIRSIPGPTFFGYPFSRDATGTFESLFGLSNGRLEVFLHSKIYLYYVVLALVVVAYFAITRLRHLPVGRAWEALREDEVACRSLGIDTTKTKLAAFSLGALFGGIAGACFAARQGFVNPESFIFMESVVVLAIVVLGGMGSMVGVVLAAIIMVGGMELLRELTFLKYVFGDNFDVSQYRFLLFGTAMVLMMLWKPRGLISTRVPTAFLHERKTVSGDLVKEGHG